jgi:hypothetical protein
MKTLWPPGKLSKPVQRSRENRWPALFLAAFFFVPLAQGHTPKVTSLTPTGGQRGTDVELKMSGARLEDAEELVFASPGIELVKLNSATTNSIKATVRIARDCPLGEHLVLVRAKSGVSELRSFHVGIYTNVAEAEPNSELTKPQKIAINSTISGTITSEDIDYFLLEAKKGERISVEIEAMRLGRGAFDPYIALMDTKGEIVAASDDSTLAMQDGFISLTSPKDGPYIIQVRETSYGGSSEYHYRLHVGNFPRPAIVYPLGGKTGESVEFKFINQDKSEFAQSIKLPDKANERFGVFAEQGSQIAPSPNWVRISPFPNVLEKGDNHDAAHATKAETELPLAFNGIISGKGESDWFRFKAKKGVALDVIVFARRLRSPIDTVLEVCDAQGKVLASNDDSAGADSAAKFTPSTDGEYLVHIKDHMGHGGPNYVYRVEVSPVQPGMTLSIPQVARYESQIRQYIVVPRGNRFATMISAKRKDLSGDLKLALDGLPAGITMEADTLAGKVDAMPVVFEAAADAAIAGKWIEPSATVSEGKSEARSTYRHVVELVQGGPNNTAYYSTTLDKLYVAVVDEAPYKLKIVEPKVPLVQYGTMDLKIVAERKPGFDEPINVKMMWNPPGVGSLPDVTIPKGESSVDYKLNAKEDAQPHVWKIAVLGTATVGGGPVWVSSQLASLEIGEPFLVGKFDPVTAEPGQTVKMVCKLDQKQPFEGKAIAKLVGLPDTAKASEAEISKDDKEVSFSITVDAKASPGSHRNLFCSMEIKKNSEIIPQNIGSGGVLRIVPPKRGKVTKLASGAK